METRNFRTVYVRRGGGGGIGVWAFFSFMYFLTTDGILPLDKWEFVWRFLAGPINFLFP